MLYIKILVALCVGCCLFNTINHAAEIDAIVIQPVDTPITAVETPSPATKVLMDEQNNTLPTQCKKLAKIDIRVDRKPVPEAAANVPSVDSGGTTSGVLDTPPVPPVAKIAIVRLYEAMHDMPLWSQNGVLTPQGQVLVKYLEQAELKGLPASAYNGKVDWATYMQGATTEDTDIVCRDLALSVAAMRYISHVRMGLVNPRSLGMRLDLSPKLLNIADFMLELARSEQPAKLLDSMEPSTYPYRVLVQTYKHYWGLQDDKQMQIPLTTPKGSVRPGQRYKDAALLAYRLKQLGDLPAEQAAAISEGIYTQELSLGVKNFQKHQGLKSDGILGAGTIKALNTPTAQLLKPLAIALERWRWMPVDTLGHRPILVNIPEYKLYALESDGKGWYKTELEMNVIVGKEGKQYNTPRVHSVIRYIEFTPYWNIPINILRNELHKSIGNPGYMASHNYEIVQGSGPKAKALPVNRNTLAGLWSGKLLLRQKPGGKNVLGEAKFVFPNDFSVYLHGTSSKGLFKREKRALSHGCIRLADPALLATHLLRDDEGWNKKRVNATITSKKNNYVKLGTATAVYLIYDTTMVNADGTIRFIPDVYKLDPDLQSALDRAKKISPPI